VSEVRTLRSTRSLKYDTKILSQMKSWTYEPTLIDGKPSKVCTTITFIYTQR
jgi:outer membrane biosynthesis protein TonB